MGAFWNFSTRAGSIRCIHTVRKSSVAVKRNAAPAFATGRTLSLDLRGKLTGTYQEADDDSAGDRHPKVWTMAHSFMAVMGGIAYQTPREEDERFVDGPACLLSLSAEALQLLGCVGLCPDISESQIRDKSKADDFGKGFACLQAGWIVVQVIGRLIGRLPVTLLEINTIGHVLCAMVIYYLWRDKPLDVHDPIVLSREPRLDSFLALMWMYSLISSSRGDVNSAQPEISCLSYYPQEASGIGRMIDRGPVGGKVHSLNRLVGDFQAPTEPDRHNPICHRRAFEREEHCRNWDDQDWKAGRKSGYEDRSGVKSHVFNMNSTTIRRWDLAGVAIDYFWLHQQPLTEAQTTMGLTAFWLPFSDFVQIEYRYEEVPNWPGLDLPHYLGPDAIRLILSISTASYRGLCASAWNAHFPSKYECILWLCCCILIAVSGFGVFVRTR